MQIIVREKEREWSPHPQAEGVKRKLLISKAEQGENITCMLVKIPKGAEVPIHTHASESDIFYTISGKCKIWADGLGDFEVDKGTVVRIPKGIRHKIHDVEQDTLLYDVFSPAIR